MYFTFILCPCLFVYLNMNQGASALQTRLGRLRREAAVPRQLSVPTRIGRLRLKGYAPNQLSVQTKVFVIL